MRLKTACPRQQIVDAAQEEAAGADDAAGMLEHPDKGPPGAGRAAAPPDEQLYYALQLILGEPQSHGSRIDFDAEDCEACRGTPYLLVGYRHT